MKKALALMLMSFVLLALPIAFAKSADNQTETPEEIQGDPGITPDSPLWGIDVALDRLSLALTSGPAKAQKGLEIAQERLLEVQAMIKEGKADAAAKAEEEDEKTVDEVNGTIEGFDGTKVDNETLRGIELGMSNHLAALAKVMARIEANPNIPADKKAKLIEKFTKLEDKADALKTKIEDKKAEIEHREEARENKTVEREANKTARENITDHREKKNETRGNETEEENEPATNDTEENETS